MRKLNTWKGWLRRAILLVMLLAALPFTVAFAGQSLNRIALILDDRSPSPQGELAGMTNFSNRGRWQPMPRESAAAAQRLALDYPPGILYVFQWTEGSSKTCLATAFVQEMWDNFGGWKSRGAFGRCSLRAYTAWVNGWNKFNGFTVAYGMAGNADLVAVFWDSGDVTYAAPIDGTFVSVLDRHEATIQSVTFLDDSGVALFQTSRPVGY